MIKKQLNTVKIIEINRSKDYWIIEFNWFKYNYTIYLEFESHK